MDPSNELVSFGYCRDHQNETHIIIPFNIMKLITNFNTKYKILGCGNNTYGQLSIGTETKLCEWKELRELANITPHYKNIYMNRQCIMVINQYNKLYISGQKARIAMLYHIHMGFGDPTQGHLIHVSLENNSEKVILLSKGIGNGHTFIYAKNNKLYGNGPNNNGELGNGQKTDWPQKLAPIPRFWNEKETLIDIQCGDGFSLFLSSNSNVYACGHRVTATDYTLKPVLIYQNIIQIAVGWSHSLETLLLNKNNELVMFGGSPYYTNPIMSYFGQNNIKIKQICSGSYHSLIISMDGNCYSFGKNDYGQCGTGYKSTQYTRISEPYLAVSNEFIIHAACGLNHSLLLSNKNNVYCFGSNVNKQCLPDAIETYYILTPYCLDKEKELKVEKTSYIDYVLASSDESLIIINPNKKIKC